MQTRLPNGTRKHTFTNRMFFFGEVSADYFVVSIFDSKSEYMFDSAAAAST